MWDAIQLYFRYLGVSLRGQMQYRASFVMLTVGLFLAMGSEYLGVWALFQRFESLRGWRLPEVALLYGMTHTAFALAEGIGRGFDTFSTLVKSGDFDRLLVRPRSTALQVAGMECQLMRVGRLALGVTVLFWAVSALQVTWTVAKGVLLVATIAGGACVFYGLFVLQATLCFWTVESLEIMNTVTYGGTETAQYPLTIYRDGFRRFFTYIIPLACLNYIPASALLERGHALGVPAWQPWAAPLVGVVFLGVALQVWKLGVLHYTSTGS